MIVAVPTKLHNGRGPWHSAVVFLDMVRQDNCVYADDVVGVVKKVVQLPGAGFAVSPMGDWLEETAYGNVTLIQRKFTYTESINSNKTVDGK